MLSEHQMCGAHGFGLALGITFGDGFPPQIFAVSGAALDIADKLTVCDGLFRDEIGFRLSKARSQQEAGEYQCFPMRTLEHGLRTPSLVVWPTGDLFWCKKDPLWCDRVMRFASLWKSCGMIFFKREDPVGRTGARADSSGI